MKNRTKTKTDAGMACSSCGSHNVRIIDTRPIQHGEGPGPAVRFRRYRCADCGNTESTYEIKKDDLPDEWA